MDSAGTLSRGAGAPQLARIVALCFLVSTLEGFDIQALGVAAPRLAPALHLAANQIGWMFAIGNIGLIVGALFGGRLADHVGRKRVLLASTLVFGLATLVMATLHDYLPLLAARFFAGVGFGAAVPNIMAIAAESSPTGRRGATIAIMMCGLPVGGALVAFVSQLLPPDLSWRTLFLIGGLLPLPIAAAIGRWLPDLYRGSGPDRSDALPVGETLFAAGRAPRTLLVWCAFLPVMAVLYLILNWLPLLVTGKGLDPRTAPQASLAFNAASMAGSVLIGAWVDRAGRRWPIAIASVALILSLLWLVQQTDRNGMLLASAATGFFLMAVDFSLYEISASQYPTRGRGTGAGAAAAVGRVGSVLGPLLAGWLLTGGASANTVLLFLVPLVAFAGLALFALSFLERPGATD